MALRFLTLLCITILYCGSSAFAQHEVDAVYLHNGSKILGTILEMVPNKHVKIRTQDGSEFVYAFDEIDMVRKEVLDERRRTDAHFDGTGNEGYFEDRNHYHSSYAELGVNLGLPAGINIAAGYWFGGIGARISGMVYGRPISGLQFNLGMKLSDNEHRSHVLAAVAGSLGLEDEDPEWSPYWNNWNNSTRYRTWEYLGVVYELNLSGFFLQAGISVGSGDFSNPQLVGQIGYMYRFLPD